MENQRNLRGLEWLVNEVETSLERACEALTTYANEGHEGPQLRFCLGYIHQVSGSLKIAECQSGLVLAEEMEQLVETMLADRVSNAGEATEVLVQAMHKLPSYLREVIETRTDRPETLLVLLNEIRAAQAEQLASENSLFAPKMDFHVPKKGSTSIPGDSALRDMTKKLRQMYQLALLGLLKGKDTEKNIRQLDKIFARTRELCRGSTREHLWRIASAVTEGVFHRSIPLSIAVRALLRDLDREFRLLINEGSQALNQPLPLGMIKNLLFYVAHSGASTPRISKVREDFSLDGALPTGVFGNTDGGLIPHYDQATVTAVATEVLEDLRGIKEGVDRFAKEQCQDTELLRAAVPVLKRIADTLAMVGRGHLRESVARILQNLTACFENVANSDDALKLLVADVLDLEAAIEGWAFCQSRQSGSLGRGYPEEMRVELDKAHHSLLREMSNGVERVKEAIVDYIASQKDASRLADVPAVIDEMVGAMLVVGMVRPAAITQSCGRFVREKMLRGDAEPDWQALDGLADAITSVEFYLETLSAGAVDEQRDVLAIAEASVAALGYPVPVVESKVEDIEIAETAVEAVSEHAVECEQADDQQQTDEPVAEMPASQADLAADGDTGTSVNLPENAAPEGPAASDLATVRDSVALPAEPVDGEEQLDPEIRDIFIEEAREVLVDLERAFSQWQANRQDGDALASVRRAFHTLKGSGRMVAASEIAELSWKQENLLNRIIENRIPANAHLDELLAAVLGILPTMIAAFAEAKPSDKTAEAMLLEAAADAMSRGEPIGAVRAIVESAATNQESEAGGTVVVGEAAALLAEPLDQDTALPQKDLIDYRASAPEQSIVPEAGAVSDVLDGREANESLEGEESLEDIFAAEASEHLATVAAFVAEANRQLPPGMAPNPPLMLALHTLKGSARTAAVDSVAVVAAPLEKFVRGLFNIGAVIDGPALALLGEAVQEIRAAIDCLREGAIPDTAAQARLLDRLSLLAADKEAADSADTDELSAVSDAKESLLDLLMDAGAPHLLDAAKLVAGWQQGSESFARDLDVQTQALVRLAASAERQGVECLSQLCRDLADAYSAISGRGLSYGRAIADSLLGAQEALLTMGDALAAHQQVRPAAAELLAELAAIASNKAAGPGETAADESDSTAGPLVSEKILVDAGADQSEVGSAADRTDDANGAIDTIEPFGAVAGHPTAILGLPDDFDPEIAAIFLEETDELLEQMEQSIQALQENGENRQAQDLLKRALHTFKGGSRMAGLTALGDSSHDFESAVIAAVQRGEHLNPDFGAGLFQQFDRLMNGVDWLRQQINHPGQPPVPAFADKIEDQPAVVASDHSVVKGPAVEPAVLAEEGAEAQTPGASAAAELAAAVPTDAGTALPDDFDPEIAATFLEETDELLEQMDQSIQALQQNGEDQQAQDLLKRALHTFKGGARMAGLTALGDSSHDFESAVINAVQRGEHLNPDFSAGLFQQFDLLVQGVSGLRQLISNPGQVLDTAVAEQRGESSESAAADAAAPTSSVSSAAPAEKAAGDSEPEAPGDAASPSAPKAGPASPRPAWPTARVIPFTGQAPASAADRKSFPVFKSAKGVADKAVDERQTTPQEMVKIAAPMLDKLVNLAGETSISRGQVEQQLNEFIHALDEMESTIRRLQDQVRRLGVETDAQVVFRMEQFEASSRDDDFDPLELDRYSQLQQLSRALLESASDLQDLKETLLDKSRDAESLLLQQSRINTDLQESLMRTRMVPFSRLVPRLRRIIRQVGGEVGKPVALKLNSVEGEMDRSVLEKMLPPLEHMIRNAIDHGIEAPAQRKEAGKSAEGTIELSFSREGGDVVIQLADDGRGLHVDAIRKRAIEKGLLDPQAVLTDREVSQFIFEPGFSTAAAVTQVSGRGVGMDVVNSEVRQLGGSIQILSEPGVGTCFVIRLPFTVSVNRVLMIEVGEDSYALALNAINGVIRLSREDLNGYYRDPSARLLYGGDEYQVAYLGSLLNDHARPNLDTALGQVSLVLVQVEQRHVAVQVDDLIGTREIVVKTLGPQFSAVPGLSGATITGDGRVVVILDLPALLRFQKAMPVTGMALEDIDRQRRKRTVATIMVVDDSVTVRKVTGRFLERQGFHVITAKDGLDAMRLLQDNTPDLMLLDIEMPRMDGFEVARLVRSTPRLQNVPIIMITSRTGEKHRQRALSMGVNRYLGKPYQEETLLSAVREWLTKAAAG